MSAARLVTICRMVFADRGRATGKLCADLPQAGLVALNCQFGWLQVTRNLLGQNNFWLQRPATIRIC